ncbi:MAG TPA: response regulator [Terriglobales bacterium]|nr:response regulator [Terriglobales bacterium]
MSARPTVLLIDDDPSHLKLYAWILERGGFRPLTLLVNHAALEFPRSEPVDLIVMDYRMGNSISAPAIARMAQEAFPKRPVLVLSDMQWMPDDIAPYAAGFARKGEPEQLLAKIRTLVNAA